MLSFFSSYSLWELYIKNLVLLPKICINFNYFSFWKSCLLFRLFFSLISLFSPSLSFSNSLWSVHKQIWKPTPLSLSLITGWETGCQHHSTGVSSWPCQGRYEQDQWQIVCHVSTFKTNIFLQRRLANQMKKYSTV